MICKEAYPTQYLPNKAASFVHDTKYVLQLTFYLLQ